MAIDLIPTLIDKQDNFEIIRDQIAAILFAEVTSQMALAVTAGKDPELWNLQIFTERSNPWEQFLNQQTVITPIINVWYESSTVDLSSSDPTKRQQMDGIFNIDCIGFGVAKGDGGTGQIPGDLEARFEVQRALRLVRNILMAATNDYLQLRGLVWGRMTNSITVFQLPPDKSAAQQIAAARIILDVSFNEFSPQVAQAVIDIIAIDIFRDEDGKLVAQAEFDLTGP